jgi:peptide methionine sulfoxide reductase MsrA
MNYGLKQTLLFNPNSSNFCDINMGGDVFWSIHNPTTKNRQGSGIGSEYRSLIAYHTLGVSYGSKPEGTL